MLDSVPPPTAAEFAGRLDAVRAQGRIDFSVRQVAGRTLLHRLDESGSLRVRFPSVTAETEAVILNTAGGIAGGDRFVTAVTVEEGARLTVTSAAAEKIYRALGPPARLQLDLSVAAKAHLLWLPNETILFDAAALDRRIDIDLAEDAGLVFVEALVLGRAAMGERLARASVIDRWRLRRGGRLVFADGLRLDGEVAATLAARASAGGAVGFATVLLAPGGDDIVTAVRGCEAAFVGEVGASAWNGIAAVRLVAPSGAALRRDLVTVLSAAGLRLPRIWLN